MGKGKEGHIMVNHPTKDKGKWDTIDLTEKANAKTVAQGVAATKKWHKENPMKKYTNGGWLDKIQVGLDVAQFVPATAGPAYLASLPFTTYDVAKDIYKGDYKQAGIDALGYIPGLKAFKHGVKTGKVLDTTSKLAKKYKKINNVVNTTNLINDVNKKENIPSKTKEVKKIKQ